jgi:hypothetical protein
MAQERAQIGLPVCRLEFALSGSQSFGQRIRLDELRLEFVEARGGLAINELLKGEACQNRGRKTASHHQSPDISLAVHRLLAVSSGEKVDILHGSRLDE